MNPSSGVTPGPAAMDVGVRSMFGSSGRWAGEKIMKALSEGRDLSPSILRTLDTLRKDEWIHLDTALVEEAVIRLRAVAAIVGAGLTIPVANAMGKTVFQYEKVTDMEPAQVSLDGVTRTEGDRQEFTLHNLPLPITHKDFWINLRTLTASRERGESLDTSQIRVAGRLIAEMSEQMLFLGSKTFGGNPVYGLLTHPNRNTTAFGTNGNWVQAAKVGEDILEDVLTLIGLLEGDRMYGPYGLFVPRNSSTKLEEDFKANSDKTIRQRLMEVEGLQRIEVCDQLTANNVVLVQMTRDVVAMVDGIPLQTVQWDVEGGFIINFKAFQLQVPLVRADADGRSGVAHMS